MRYIYSLVLILSLVVQTLGQNVNVQPTFSPEFFGMNEPVTITYDVTGTKLSNLTTTYLWIWAPDASVDAPTNVNPANSNMAVSDAAMFIKTKTAEGRTQFSITITPKDFLNSGTKEVKKIGLLLKGNDWADGQTVDAIVQITDGFALKVEKPSSNYGFYTTETKLDLVAKTSATATITLYVDQQNIESVSAKEYISSHTLIKDGSVHELLITAVTATDSTGFRHTYIANALTTTAILLPRSCSQHQISKVCL
jgi:hypothetical protein